MKSFPQTLKPSERESIRGMVCECFNITQEELDFEILGEIKLRNQLPQTTVVGDAEARKMEMELDSILPKDGFFRRYVEYTAHSEAPLAYHIFSALCGVGAVVNRRVWFNMGYYKLYPTLGIIILGPSGIKKTSAANIAVDLLQTVGLVKIYSEKLTPEALIEAMKGDNATGLVYAPEMTVFLNKQKYNEGLVQLITRFMDCPDVWESGTIGRGKSVVRNVAISSLMCSTLDWFVRSTPTDSFGGGFIARNLLVVQEASARCEPIPNPGDDSLRSKLISNLSDLHAIEGEITFDRISYARYIDWYSTTHQSAIKHPSHELLATYYNRKPDHAKRVGMCMHIAEHRDLVLCDECFERALKLLDWSEQFLPAMLERMFKNDVGEAQEEIVKIITRSGKMPHSDLVRKLSYKMNAGELRTHLQTLVEGRQIVEMKNNIGHYYIMRVEE